MTEKRYDVVVIGTGPGGEGAAMQSAKGGKQVAVIEAYDKIGGGCTHWGTIPSKALRFSIYSVMEAMNNPIVRELGIHLNPTLAQLRASSQAIISKQVSMRQTFYDRNNVPVIHGRARLIDANTVEIDEETRISGDNIVLATGSRPFRPEGVDLRKPSKHGPENFGFLRRFVISLLKRDTSKGSLRLKRKRAGWNIDFLEQVLKNI